MNKILEIKFGSHLYGTNTPESDTDFKGIYLPTAREIVLGNYKKTIAKSRPKASCERNTKDDIDIEIFSLDRFLELLMEGQTVALDILFAPNKVYTNNYYGGTYEHIWLEIYRNKEKLLTRNVNAFVGYARQQAAKYGIKGSRLDALKRVVAFLEPLPDWDRLGAYTTGIDELVKTCSDLISLEKTPLVEIVNIPGPNKVDLMPHLHVCGRKVGYGTTVKLARECYGKVLDGYGNRAHKAHLAGGVDWKALSHAVRVNSEALELLSTGFITFPRPDRELLLAIKLGQMPYEQVAELIEQGLADLYTAHDKSSLRDKPDQEWADNLVYEVYSKIVKETI